FMRVSAVTDEFSDSQAIRGIGHLGQQAQPFGDIFCIHGEYVFSVHQHRAVFYFQHSCESVQKRRLAAAVWSDDGSDLSFWYRHIKVFNYDFFIVACSYIPHFEYVHDGYVQSLIGVRRLSISWRFSSSAGGRSSFVPSSLSSVSAVKPLEAGLTISNITPLSSRK